MRMCSRKATFASDHVLELLRGRKCGDDSLEFRGWRFESTHGYICTSQEQEDLKFWIESIVKANDDPNFSFDRTSLRIPPMLFLNDVFRLRSPSGHCILIRAKDALLTWANEHSSPRLDETVARIPQVPFASDWAERSVGDNENTNDPLALANQLKKNSRKWDWTFLTDYAGTVSPAPACDATKLSASCEPPGMSVYCIVGGRHLSQQTKEMDCCENAYVCVDSEVPETHSKNCRTQWKRAEKSGIDISLLSSTTDPILFYDEINLFQDDLEDCGEISVTAKIRVMPECWFVLLRVFMRVDGCVIRIREARWFHRFSDGPDRNVAAPPTESAVDVEPSSEKIGSDLEPITLDPAQENNVHVTITWKEVQLSSPVNPVPRGGPTGVRPMGAVKSSPFNPPFPSSAGGSDPAGSRDLRDQNSISQTAPVVNQREGIHEYYTLTLL